ncbi:putative O-glycosylation ligase, exosortase A system-associated [Desulfobacter postgatei]|uniref:putative O-glycosylation ligase, exosortase A system-associated n=1 Tax=Desulfobacter postgatei TaxID=2293 RepID=UPI002A35F391|nr:putative O-glycosylation ligase, exosortase A system-associated [Desulfobacter postgatei]MDX9964233.1 putative O-glycosylation ligase, exosortase A system-associated [Desulfobacter postgatei]
MRDFIVLVFFIASIPISFLNPVRGVLCYALVSYLNPHRLTWGFAFSLPIAKVIALATLAGYLFYNGDKALPKTREIILLTILWALAFIGWPMALNPSGYVAELQRFSKILLMIYMTVCLIKTKEDLRLLMLIIALSIGFYTVKGGVWGLRGGSGWVRGPAGTFFGDNNEMGMVINMAWPLFLFIAYTEKNKWMGLALRCCFWIAPLTVVLTKSRGAALAMAVTGSVLFMRVKNKVLILLIGSALFFAFIPFVPQEWYSRMRTVETYEQDASAMGRINAWHAAWNMAVDRPLTGGGLRAFTGWTIYKYAPNPNDFHDVHSIYFEILGELGFPGIAVYLSLIAAVLLKLRVIKNRARYISDGAFYINYSNAITLGLVAYLTNGLTLGLAYFDLFYQYVGITVSLYILLQRDIYMQSQNDGMN